MSKSTCIILLLFLTVLISFLSLNYAFSHNAPFASLLLNKVLDTKVASSNSPLQEDAKKKLQSENTLSLSPDLQTVREGRVNTVSVVLNSQGTSPTLIQLEISFDPRALISLDIAPGNFFTSPKVLLKNIDYNNGRISYALESSTTEHTSSNQNPIAIISFMESQATIQNETTLYFLPKTTIKVDGDISAPDLSHMAKIMLIHATKW